MPEVGFQGSAVWISPSSPELEGSARAAAEVPRQIANANTFFNVINTLLFIGFTTWFARLAEWLVRDRPPEEGVIARPEFLDNWRDERPREVAVRVPDPREHDLPDQQLPRRDAAWHSRFAQRLRRPLGTARCAAEMRSTASSA